MIIERDARPPPEKMLRRERNWLPEKKDANALWSIPGIATTAKTLASTRIPIVIKILLLRTESLSTRPTLSIKVLNI